MAIIGNREKHRLVSLVPPIHICILRRKNIVDTMSEAPAKVPSDPMISSLKTLVTGP
ncbi:MAG: LUD domain-containing protein [Planctomycetes bacterium]|nr:LUD domain-containing protein [Planctomycetota bacterium]